MGGAAPAAAEGHPADLHVAEKGPFRWVPSIPGSSGTHDIHKRAPGLAGAKLP